MPPYRQLCWVSNLLEMSDYIPNRQGHNICCTASLAVLLLRSRPQLISLLLEKLLKLDAHLSRSAIEESNRAAAAGEQETVNPLVAALDVYMKAMFIDIEENLHTEGQFDGKKGEEMVALLLEVFTSQVLVTTNTTHSQFLFLYTASLHPFIIKRFLQQIWKTFSNVKSPSIVRQVSAMFFFSNKATIFKTNLESLKPNDIICRRRLHTSVHSWCAPPRCRQTWPWPGCPVSPTGWRPTSGSGRLQETVLTSCTR